MAVVVNGLLAFSHAIELTAKGCRHLEHIERTASRKVPIGMVIQRNDFVIIKKKKIMFCWVHRHLGIKGNE